METGQRTVVKAVLWNLLGLGVMAAVGFLATGSAALGGAMALINTSVGFLIYLVYERVWAHIAWGRV